MKIFLASDIHTEFAHQRFDPSTKYSCLRFDHPNTADVVSNPRGYPRSPAPGFDEERLIEV